MNLETLSKINPEALTLQEYQEMAQITGSPTPEQEQSITFLSLGLIGEVGSLISEVKNKLRDDVSHIHEDDNDSILEEIGDTLWYFSVLAKRTDFQLHEVAGVSMEATFSSIQADSTQSSETLEKNLLHLANTAGSITAMAQHAQENLAKELKNFFRTLIAVTMCEEINVQIANAAHANLEKIFDRWPAEQNYPALFDDDEGAEERLPRKFEIEIMERKINNKVYVYQRCNGVYIGDRLTDNSFEPDDYRFHDVFHLAYAAILGWSPLTRALLKVKRKSKPETDEVEDGARAILIEESISIWIFNHARKLNYFKDTRSLNFSMLKTVRELVEGCEVHQHPLWLWELAILEGFKMFRSLRKHRRGRIVVDLEERTIKFEEIKS